MLTAEMKNTIRNFSAGSVATVNKDGTPSVSPKATFVILNDKTVAFGNLRSPGTLANLRINPAIEVCFTDILARKAVRATGNASIIRKDDAPQTTLDAFNDSWAQYVPDMSFFVVIEITNAEMILSPGYDHGFTEEELKASNLKHILSL